MWPTNDSEQRDPSTSHFSAGSSWAPASWPVASIFRIIMQHRIQLTVSSCSWFNYGTVLMSSSAVSTVMGIFAIAAIFSEVGNGANFSLVPHCHPRNNASSFKKIYLQLLANCAAGFHFRNRRWIWKPGWRTVRTNSPISTRAWKGILDHRCRVHSHQYSFATNQVSSIIGD